MNRLNWILVIIIVFTWWSEELYHLAPRNTQIQPFIFSNEELSVRWYIYEVIKIIRFIALGVCFLIMTTKSKYHWIVLDTIKLTLTMEVFTLFWFVLFYNNPFYTEEWWIKIIITSFVYFSILSMRYHATGNNNSIFNRRFIRRID